MVSRNFCLPGIFFLFAAFVLNLLVSISLPSLPALDIARSRFSSSTGDSTSVVHEAALPAEAINQIRYGIWAYCVYDSAKSDRTCLDTGHGYSTQLDGPTNNIKMGGGWTRGLAVHPVAAVVTFIALVMSFSQHVTWTLLASLTAFLAALLTLIAFAIDIALFVFVHDKNNNLSGVHVRSNAGPGLWCTLAAFILLLLGGCTACFGRRRERMSNATTYPEKPGFLGRMRYPFRGRGTRV
ncbi:pali-domain-containing protein [Auriscalpium vulgare]|uniref:Pali-domain-containing protein n=1 Tax=Auriscalpium vulgare TaxID=40419 RepID=A0ACB8RGM2_9AGAM|nr:pali-domain-containing protein [Auriscalpium vulgare]